MKASRPTAADDALDRLYAAPFDDFVAQRRALGAEVRAAGDLAGARDVLAAKKPSRTVWALNQVARRDPEILRAAFDAHDAATSAQSSGDAASMRETARAFRERIADVVRRCGDVLAEGDARLNATQARRLGETVRAAVTGGPEARAQLLAGRLTEDVDVEDPFAGLVAPPAGSSKKPAQHVRGEEATKARDDEARRAREARKAQEARERSLEQARREVEALEGELRDARAAAREAETVAARAQASADRARRGVAVIEERLAKARRAMNEG
jgi:hypothetical protein